MVPVKIRRALHLARRANGGGVNQVTGQRTGGDRREIQRQLDAVTPRHQEGIRQLAAQARKRGGAVAKALAIARRADGGEVDDTAVPETAAPPQGSLATTEIAPPPNQSAVPELDADRIQGLSNLPVLGPIFQQELAATPNNAWDAWDRAVVSAVVSGKYPESPPAPPSPSIPADPPPAVYDQNYALPDIAPPPPPVFTGEGGFSAQRVPVPAKTPARHQHLQIPHLGIGTLVSGPLLYQPHARGGAIAPALRLARRRADGGEVEDQETGQAPPPELPAPEVAFSEPPMPPQAPPSSAPPIIWNDNPGSAPTIVEQSPFQYLPQQSGWLDAARDYLGSVQGRSQASMRADEIRPAYESAVGDALDQVGIGWDDLMHNQPASALGRFGFGATGYLASPFTAATEALVEHPAAAIGGEDFGRRAGLVAGLPFGGGEATAAAKVAANLPHEAMFGGIGAAGADLSKLRRASGMETAGATPAEIWDATGWWRGADKRWRFEIPDQGARVIGVPRAGYEKPLSAVLRHPELYRQYPDIASIPVQRLTKAMPEYEHLTGLYLPPYGRQRERMFLRPYSDMAGDRVLYVALHEAQHALQNRERFDPRSIMRQEREAQNVEQRSMRPAEFLRAVPPSETDERLFGGLSRAELHRRLFGWRRGGAVARALSLARHGG